MTWAAMLVKEPCMLVDAADNPLTVADRVVRELEMDAIDVLRAVKLAASDVLRVLTDVVRVVNCVMSEFSEAFSSVISVLSAVTFPRIWESRLAAGVVLGAVYVKVEVPVV